jgi:hypothetical protein
MLGFSAEAKTSSTGDPNLTLFEVGRRATNFSQMFRRNYLNLLASYPRVGVCDDHVECTTSQTRGNQDDVALELHNFSPQGPLNSQKTQKGTKIDCENDERKLKL